MTNSEEVLRVAKETVAKYKADIFEQDMKLTRANIGAFFSIMSDEYCKDGLFMVVEDND